MSYAIKTEELSKRYGRVQALNGLNLKVPEGAIYALVGPNGAGKTTTLKLLLNVLRPTSGNCEVLGVASERLRYEDLAVIGYVSENQDVPDWMTGRYLLSYLRPFYPTWDDGLAYEIARDLALPLDQKIKTLSRGARMKLAVVSSLTYRPRLIVLDEPFAGLDPVVRDQLIQTLLQRVEGATVVISSHDLHDLESFVSHVGYLDRGRLCFSEEISFLVERFRAVAVTLEATPRMPLDWPRNWICRESSSAVVHFIETRFDSESTPTEINRRFVGSRNVSFTPMSLRAIFTAVARSSSGAA